MTGTTRLMEWLESIRNKGDKQRILSRLKRLEHGHYGDCKSIGRGLFELRLFGRPAYRLYFARDRGILLLAGGKKKTQKRDIPRARKEIEERSVGDYPRDTSVPTAKIGGNNEASWIHRKCRVAAPTVSGFQKYQDIPSP